MKHLVLGSALAIVATGCVIEADVDNDNDGLLDSSDLCPNQPEDFNGFEDNDGCPDGGSFDYATVGVTWSIKSVNGATATSCPPGYDTMALFNVAVDASGTPIAPCTGPASISDTCFVDLFNCTGTGSAVSSPLPPTRYQTWISITDHDGTNAYATSLSAFLDVRDIDLNFNASIFTDGGFFIVDWDLKGAVSNAPLTCAQASATSVETVVTVAGGSTVVDSGNPWPCEDHYGATAALPVGVYTVSVDAFNPTTGLGVAPEFTNKAIAAPNRVTDLGTAIIAIDGL